ncbi:MAG TPA: RluA family pseudouridine synthase [Steroidobacteraceae bacterium]|nr:RluA family pseudouridine synthase [Steroidobacteraceae bacterium]
MSEQPEGQVREGVRHITVTEDQAGVRLDNFLTKLLGGVPRSRVFRIVRRGEVRVNGKRAGPEIRLQAGDSVRVPPVNLPAPDAPPPVARVPRSLIETVRQAIIRETDRLIVVNKPAGIAVHGGSGVSFGIIEALRAARPEETLELVHRLDRDTSGCLLVARKPAALRVLHAMMRDGQVEKGYLALLKGPWDLGKKRIDLPLNTEGRVGGERTVRVQAGGKSAASTFSPVQFFRNVASMVEVDLDTGRTHQIRVHAAHVGHPVAGDDKYGDQDFNARLREQGLTRMFLHAHRISFDWPNGGDFSASAPLPADLAAVLDALGESTSARNSRRRR